MLKFTLLPNVGLYIHNCWTSAASSRTGSQGILPGGTNFGKSWLVTLANIWILSCKNQLSSGWLFSFLKYSYKLDCYISGKQTCITKNTTSINKKQMKANWRPNFLENSHGDILSSLEQNFEIYMNNKYYTRVFQSNSGLIRMDEMV